MEKNACGILSYAGLGREALLALAKAAFIQAQQPVPRRFEAFLPIFPVELVQNMDYMGPTDARGAMVSPSGFSTDPAEYHKKMYAQLPDLYAEDNYSRNFDYEGRFVGRGVFTVDRAFADHFPQYDPFMGEKLMIYLIGGGFQAVAVPESVYPRGGGLLQTQEQAMQITARVELFVQYVKTRVAAGDRYDADTFAADYLRAGRHTPVTFTQEELSRILQDLSIVRSLQSDTASVGLYTQSARKAERVLQYVPMRYACDLFAPEAVDKHTARLAQLCFADADFISDLWIPWQDFAAYIDRRTMVLDARALCEGYQIAPRYDADTFGGRYPDQVRVAVVRDRDLRLMVGEAINNPAYGSGMGPQGTIGRHAYIADSREMLRQRKLALEETNVAVENTTLPPAEYRKAVLLAVLQEHKGRLVDAMYRRETVLSQIEPGTPVYEKAAQLLGERVTKLEEVVRREGKQSGRGQMSGYDADIDYLTRKRQGREGEPQVPVTGKRIAFAPDPLREQSIESGYAMRAGLLRMAYAEAALPEPPAAPPVGADDSEDEAAPEHLPPIVAGKPKAETPAPAPAKPMASPAAPVKPAAAVPVPDTLAVPEADEVPVAVQGKTSTWGKPAPAPVKYGTAQAGSFVGGDIRKQSADIKSVDKPAVAPVAGQLAHAVAKGQSPTSQPAAAAKAKEDNVGDAKRETPDVPASPADETAASEGVENGDAPAASESPDASAPLQGHALLTTVAKPARIGRVSLRELSRRAAPEPEPKPEAEAKPAGEAEPAKPEEPPKPKLAYILRRGSEGAASQSYSRMSEMLKKKGKQ